MAFAKPMAALLGVLAIFTAAIFTVAGAAEPAAAKQLFNGKDLEGWQHIGPGRFVLEDGLLKTEGGMGLLWYTKEKFGDCVLRVVYKTSKASDNSGVYVRIADKPMDPWYAVHHGYEVQIAEGAGAAAYRTTGAVYTFAEAKAKPSKKPGEWNTLEVTLKGDRVQTAINGVDVADFDSRNPPPELAKRGGQGDPEAGPRPTSGYIGLQNHDDRCTVYFKEVSVRPLPEK